MNLDALMDTPRIYTALAEWGACILYVLLLRRKVTGWKLPVSPCRKLARIYRLSGICRNSSYLFLDSLHDRSRISDVPPSASALRYYLAGCRILLRTGTGSGRIYRVLSLAALCLVGVELRQKQSVILDFDHAALIHRHLYRILLSGKRTFSD